jgi:hypothetical protein
MGKVKIPGYGSGGMSAAAPLASSGEEERTSSTSEAASPSSSPCLRASKLSPDQEGQVLSSVADPGCLSRIPDPDFYPSRIQKQQQKRRVKKICCRTFLCSYKFHIIENYLFLKCGGKKMWANFQRIIELFTQKIAIKLSKLWLWDPGSGKNLFLIPDSGVKKAPDPGSGSATLVVSCVKLTK